MAKPTDKSGLVCDWVILIGPFDPVFGSKGNAVGTKLAHGRQWEHICLQTWISMIVTWYLCVCVCFTPIEAREWPCEDWGGDISIYSIEWSVSP